MDQREAWEELYRSNPGAWRGNAEIPLPCRGDALDVGCGNGKTAWTLIESGFRVCGVDFSETAVRQCRERFGDRAEFEVCDATAIPFPDGTFDYITAVHLCEHLSDEGIRLFASECRRLLRPGGYVFVRSFDADDFRSARRSSSDIAYFHRYPDDMICFFTGLEVVSAETVRENTRFGTVRSRTECLMRRRRSQHRL